MGNLIRWPLAIDSRDHATESGQDDSGPTVDEIEMVERVWSILDDGMRTLKRCLQAADAAVAMIGDQGERQSLEQNILFIRSVLSRASQRMAAASQMPLAELANEDDVVA